MRNSILFVDNDPLILSSLRRLVHRKKEWACEFSPSAVEALRLLEKNCFDVVVTDIIMPEMNGLELLAAIKRSDKLCDTEVIIMTGLEEEELKQHALDIGAVDLLNKPIAKEELIARLNSVLRMKSYRDQLVSKNEMLEEQLASSQKMELVGTLAAGAAHDLKNLLVVIGGMGNLMQPQTGNNLDKADKFNHRKKILLDTVHKAENLVKQILTFSRRLPATATGCDIVTVITETMKMFESILPKTVTINLEGRESGCRVQANSTHLNQILMNLILNATQAMAGKGEIIISLHRPKADALHLYGLHGNLEEYVQLEVSDTGPGVSSKVIDHIFEPLFTTKKENEGTGLGLYVTKWLVDNMGGQMSVNSIAGSGTTFTVFLQVFQD